MVPRPTRRQYLSGLSIAALGALAGCTGSSPESGDSPTTQNTTTEQTTAQTTESDGNSTTAGSPAAAVRRYFTTATEDPAATREYFHPIHPFSPENLSAAEAKDLFGQASQPEDVSLETKRRDVTAETIQTQSVLQATDLETSDVAAAIEGEQTAIVEADFTQADGETETTRFVVVTRDGGWVILAQGFQPKESAGETESFDARVVDDVTFDTEKDTARIELVDNPVADELTVTAEAAGSKQSTTTLEAVEYLSSQVDPDGDTLVVTATIDGETREVHREQYPPSAAFVEDITYDDEPDSDARDAIARVMFSDDSEKETFTVEATISGYESTFEVDGSLRYVVAGIDPGGDEIVVSRATDDASTVVHRERYHP